MKVIFCLLGCIAFAMALLFYPREVVQGTLLGKNLCLEVLLPSLFPFMILSAFLARSGAGELLSRPFLPITRLIRLPDATAPVLIASMIGGYPTGAAAILSLTEAGRLPRQDAERLLLCAVNAGPAFVVIAVGERMFGSTALGWRLLLSQVISSLLLCLLFCRRKKNEAPSPCARRNVPVSRALVESVSQATQGFISIGSYVLLVSVVLSLLSLLPFSPIIRATITGLLEVTTGCSAAAAIGGRTGALLAAFFLCFGGIAVCFQVFSLVLPFGLSTRRFLLSRLIGGMMGVLMLLLMLPDLSISSISAVAIPCSAAFLPAANSPNRLLGALCMMAMSAQLFARIDRCTAREAL